MKQKKISFKYICRNFRWKYTTNILAQYIYIYQVNSWFRKTSKNNDNLKHISKNVLLEAAACCVCVCVEWSREARKTKWLPFLLWPTKKDWVKKLKCNFVFLKRRQKDKKRRTSSRIHGMLLQNYLNLLKMVRVFLFYSFFQSKLHWYILFCFSRIDNFFKFHLHVGKKAQTYFTFNRKFKRKKKKHPLQF